MAWVLLDADPSRQLGAALGWARHRRGVPAAAELHLIVDDPRDAAHVTRRAGAFAEPPTVWRVDGRSLLPVAAAALPPGPVPAPDVEPLARLAEAGAEVVVEDGVVSGEVLGLEVARVVDGEGGARLEVGVGRFDRESFALLHGELTDDEALAWVIATVREHRRPGAPSHPLNRMAPERWLRTLLIAEPDVVGATALEALPPVLPRRGLLEQAPAPARGDGVLVTCSVGVDLDLVPAAADARLVHAPDARLVLVVPDRDRHPVTLALAASLARPAEVVGVRADWRAAGTLRR